MNILIKDQAKSPGQIVSNRYTVKVFDTLDALYSFMGKGSNALHWSKLNNRQMIAGKVKNGTYRSSIEKIDGKSMIVFRAV